MKRIIIGALLLASTAQLRAQHEYLTLRAKNGDETSVKVTNQTVLKFENGNLKATTNGATTEFALSNLKAFFFAAQPTIIAESVANKSFVKLTASHTSTTSCDRRISYMEYLALNAALGKGGSDLLKRSAGTTVCVRAAVYK